MDILSSERIPVELEFGMNSRNMRKSSELAVWLWKSGKGRVLRMMLRNLVFVVKGITYSPTRTHLITKGTH